MFVIYYSHRLVTRINSAILLDLGFLSAGKAEVDVKVIIVVIEILAAVWTDQMLHYHISRYIDKVIHLILSCNTFCSKRDAD
ncbi:MAG: hypothetical protein NTX81_03010 [Candidatus Bathyarchaeota archaeon]|nr:hypothetical protein [Candidatus Bathyarchaeota archaeon]